MKFFWEGREELTFCKFLAGDIFEKFKKCSKKMKMSMAEVIRNGIHKVIKYMTTSNKNKGK